MKAQDLSINELNSIKEHLLKRLKHHQSNIKSIDLRRENLFPYLKESGINPFLYQENERIESIDMCSIYKEKLKKVDELMDQKIMDMI